MLAITGYAGNLKKKNPAIKTIVIDAGHGGHDLVVMAEKAKKRKLHYRLPLKLGKLISEKIQCESGVYS